MIHIIVLQEEDGLLNFVFLIIFLLILAYLLGLPAIACYQLSKTWKLKNKIILFVTYYGLLSCLTIILLVIPDYYWRTYYWDITYTYRDFFVVIRYMFLLLPAMYPGIVGFAQFFKEIIGSRKQSKQPQTELK